MFNTVPVLHWFIKWLHTACCDFVSDSDWLVGKCLVSSNPTLIDFWEINHDQIWRFLLQQNLATTNRQGVINIKLDCDLKQCWQYFCLLLELLQANCLGANGAIHMFAVTKICRS